MQNKLLWSIQVTGIAVILTQTVLFSRLKDVKAVFAEKNIKPVRETSGRPQKYVFYPERGIRGNGSEQTTQKSKPELKFVSHFPRPVVDNTTPPLQASDRGARSLSDKQKFPSWKKLCSISKYKTSTERFMDSVTNTTQKNINKTLSDIQSNM